MICDIIRKLHLNLQPGIIAALESTDLVVQVPA